MMLRQALVVLGPRTLLPVALIGGAALAVGALMRPSPATAPRYQLLLNAPDAPPRTFYISAWAEGDVIVGHDGSDGRPIVFTRRAEEPDGCTWQSMERLVPLSASTYHYQYSEQILSCRPGSKPYLRSPRVGLVTVEKADAATELTELTGVQSPYDLDSLDNGSDMEGDDAELIEVRAAVDEAMAEAEAAVRDAEEAADDASAAVEELTAHALDLSDDSDDE